MWKLYDDLYIGIPSGLTIDSCIIGDKWVTVRLNGNVGIARLLEPPTRRGDEFTGAYLRDTGCHMRWNDLTRASVGVAALCAWYNTPERAEGLKNREYSYEDIKGRIAVVGDCPFFESRGTEYSDFPLPLDPDGVTADIYGILPGYDAVIISSDAVITRSIPALLDTIGEDGCVIIDGYSTPMSPSFFAFDMPVKRLNGIFRKYDNTMENAARLGLTDIEPGTLPFSVAPFPPKRVHEQDNLKNFMSSPYSASKFNQGRFADWEGRRYDRGEWSGQYKG